jgi:hypothetical protein
LLTPDPSTTLKLLVTNSKSDQNPRILLEPTGSTDTSLKSKVAEVKMTTERRVKFEPNLSSITERIKTLSTMAAITEANFFDKEN